MSDENKNINSGEPIEVVEEVGAELSVKPKKRIKWGILGGAAAVVVAAGVALGAAFGGGSPMGLVATGIKNSAKAIGENAIVSMAKSVVNGGSTEVSVDLETIGEMMGGYLELDGTAAAKIYTDLSNKQMAITAGVKLDAVDEFDASLFLNESGIALASEWLLGGESYGVSLKDFAKNFENSEFGSGGEYDLEIELPEKTESITAEVEKMAEDSKKVSVAIVAELLKQLEENAEIEKDEAELTFNGKAAKTTAVTVSMDHKQLFAVISGMLNYVRTDEGIRTYIENYAEYVLKVAQAGYEIDEEDVEEFVEEFYEELDVLCEEELDYLEEELEEYEVSALITFHISKSGKQLVGIEFEVEADDEKIKGSAYAGPDLKKAEELNFRLSIDGEVYRATYVVKTDDAKEFKSELKVRADSETVFEADVEWDKEDGAFKITASDGWDEVVVRGTLEKADKNTTVFIKSVGVDDEKITLGVTVVLSPGDKMPAMPAYTDILTMTADEIEEVIGELEEVVEELVYGLYW